MLLAAHVLVDPGGLGPVQHNLAQLADDLPLELYEAFELLEPLLQGHTGLGAGPDD